MRFLLIKSWATFHLKQNIWHSTPLHAPHTRKYSQTREITHQKGELSIVVCCPGTNLSPTWESNRAPGKVLMLLCLSLSFLLCFSSLIDNMPWEQWNSTCRMPPLFQIVKEGKKKGSDRQERRGKKKTRGKSCLTTIFKVSPKWSSNAHIEELLSSFIPSHYSCYHMQGFEFHLKLVLRKPPPGVTA